MVDARGSLFIISAPSGAGKTSLVKALVEKDGNLHASVSHTTRPPRPGEKEGSNYHFVKKSFFDKMVNQGEFLESAQVFDHFYGTSKLWVQSQLEAGTDVVLEIDWQGAKQIKEHMPLACAIFILPPSKNALQERLMSRGQDNPEVIERRMDQAVNEMSHFESSDYLVLNRNFEEALNELEVIVKAQRLRTVNRSKSLGDILSDMLKFGN
tara:strand:+ start:3065 stop:3694 length:630 start_codon:yes stop_codon:yes gene_type:complete